MNLHTRITFTLCAKEIRNRTPWSRLAPGGSATRTRAGKKNERLVFFTNRSRGLGRLSRGTILFQAAGAGYFGFSSLGCAASGLGAAAGFAAV
jgi:hypothetical protein